MARTSTAVPAPEPVTRALRGARTAVGLLFLTNGATFASVVPRYPELQDRLGLSNAALGAAVSAYWAGALVVGLLAGAVVHRRGSARAATAAAVLAAANLLLLAAAPSWLALCGALAVAGALDSVADVAENAHALRVERGYRRSILNSLHGLWSIGAVAGGLTSSAAAGAGVPLLVHLGCAAALLAGLAGVASRSLLRGPDPAGADPAGADPAGAPVPLLSAAGRPVRAPGSRLSPALRPALGVVVLGLVATLAQGVEDTGATWSPVYLRHDLGAAPAVAGLGFVVLQAAQTLGRLLGDRVVTRFGDVAVARAGAALGGAAVAVALVVPSVVATVVALGAAGLGIATLIPAAMRRADAVPGLRPGAGLALAGSVARVGSLVAPPLVGLAADASSLRVALVTIPAAAAAVVVLASALRGPRPAAPAAGAALGSSA